MSVKVVYGVIKVNANTYTGDLLKEINDAAEKGWRVVPGNFNGCLGGILMEHDAPVPSKERLDAPASTEE